MEQSAVEFISKGLFDILQEAENNNILEVGTQNFKRYIEMFEKQAKEMEKQQIENAFDDGFKDNSDYTNPKYRDAEQYYNEKFKNKLDYESKTKT